MDTDAETVAVVRQALQLHATRSEAGWACYEVEFACGCYTTEDGSDWTFNACDTHRQAAQAIIRSRR